MDEDIVLTPEMEQELTCGADPDETPKPVE